MDVAVKNDSDEFARLIHHRAPAVSADDVGVGDEIEMGRKIEIGFLIDPPLREIEWSLVIVFGRALIQTGEIGKWRDLFSVLFVPTNGSVG